ncbi:MAG: type II toxin-antitoxin system Phd/YefM family antitoxin [Acidimicrobiales bacterium]
MPRIGVRELRRHAGRYLEQLKAGEVVEITERGKLVAPLTPPARPLPGGTTSSLPATLCQQRVRFACRSA